MTPHPSVLPPLLTCSSVAGFQSESKRTMRFAPTLPVPMERQIGINVFIIYYHQPRCSDTRGNAQRSKGGVVGIPHAYCISVSHRLTGAQRTRRSLQRVDLPPRESPRGESTRLFGFWNKRGCRRIAALLLVGLLSRPVEPRAIS